MMNDHGKSDKRVVSAKELNKSPEGESGMHSYQKELAEALERRRLAKGNTSEQNTRRIQCR